MRRLFCLLILGLLLPLAAADHDDEEDDDGAYGDGPGTGKGSKKDRDKGGDREEDRDREGGDDDEERRGEGPAGPEEGSAATRNGDGGDDEAVAAGAVPPRVLEPGTCPSLSVTTQGKGRIQVDTDGAGGELHRAGPDGDLRRVHRFDGSGAYQDKDTIIGDTYTYVLMVDGVECARVETTAVPVFPRAAAAVAATLAGIGAFLWHRRAA